MLMRDTGRRLRLLRRDMGCVAREEGEVRLLCCLNCWSTTSSASSSSSSSGIQPLCECGGCAVARVQPRRSDAGGRGAVVGSNLGRAGRRPLWFVVFRARDDVSPAR